MAEYVYSFRFSDGRVERFPLHFDEQMVLVDRAERTWTSLAFHHCDHCPLPVEHGQCPFATALVPIIERFGTAVSFERVWTEIHTPQRQVAAEKALQHALASLIGLVGATSGCSHLAFFRPMARFHLPFASEEETLVRAFSFHLLADWINGRDLRLDDLAADYDAAARVNRGMAVRLRHVFSGDAVINALVSLDTYAQAIPFVIEEKLAELAYIFAPE